MLGLLIIIGYTVAGCFSLFLRYELIGTGYLPRGAICVLMLLIIINPLLRRISERLALRRRELLLIFLMLLVMSAVPGQEYGQHVYLNILGTVWFVQEGIADPDLYLNDLSGRLVPSLDREDLVIRGAYEGLQPGQPVPYGQWVRPLLVWTPFYLALYFLIICFAGIFSPRWEEHERLLFPLTQVPVELTEAETGHIAPMLKDRGLWICFGIGTALFTVKLLHQYFPVVPDIDLQRRGGVLFGTGPGSAFDNLPMHVYPEMIGIAYLLTAEVGFSLWFFFLFRRVQQFARITVGLDTGHGEFFRFQTIGGYAVLGVAVLWASRDYLRDVWRAAIGRGSSETLTGPQPYRIVVFGAIASMLFIWWWCVQAGMSLLWAIVFFGTFPIVSMVASRVLCEAGMFIYSSPFRLNEAIFDIAGTGRIGRMNVTLMTMTSWCQTRSTATLNMPAVFQGYKIASDARFNRTRIPWVLWGSIGLGILVCHIMSPYVIYRWGIPKLGWWPSRSSHNTVNKLVAYLGRSTEMAMADWVGLALGGATTIFLVLMRQRFLWWPFHPLGFIAWLGWPIDRYWFSILVGWLAKIVVVRFFGFSAFRRLRPAAFGLILGVCFIITVSLIVHFFYPAESLVRE
ncbi:MAG: hypothetical protein PVH68_03210 [Armatimonadota bacterium]